MKFIFTKILLSLFLYIWASSCWALEGSGTKCRPYLIANETDLNEFVNYANVSGKLTADFSIQKGYSFKVGHICLDLNRYTITQNATNSSVFYVDTNVTLEVTANGGGIVNNNSTTAETKARRIFETSQGSTLIVEGGTYDCYSQTSAFAINGIASLKNITVSNYAAAIGIFSSASAELNGCSANSLGSYAVYNLGNNTKIIGGTYTNTADWSTIYVHGGSMEISDTEVENKKSDFAVSAENSTTLSIYSGSFKANNTSQTVHCGYVGRIYGGRYTNTGIGTIFNTTTNNFPKIYGGTFNKEKSDVKGFIEQGYTLQSGTDGNYVINSTSYSFSANGGTGSMEKLIIQSSNTLTPNSFTRPDYTFQGWNTKADGSGTAYTDGQNVDYIPGASFTLYAQWTKDIKLNEDPENKGNFLTTFYSSESAFILPENANAYKGVLSDNGDYLHLEPITGHYLPKGEAVILKSNTNTISLSPTLSTTSKDETNMMEGVDQQVTQNTYGSGTYYMLTYGQYGLGLYKMGSNAELVAGKAFLRLEGDPSQARVKAFILDFEDEETAVPSVNEAETNNPEHNQIFNLNGQQVVRPQKGLYIKNGKKMLVK